MIEEDPLFWEIHEEENGIECTDDFKELFSKMVNPNPKVRANIKEIKESLWYKKPVYSNAQVKEIMSKHIEEDYKNKNVKTFSLTDL